MNIIYQLNMNNQVNRIKEMFCLMGYPIRKINGVWIYRPVSRQPCRSEGAGGLRRSSGHHSCRHDLCRQPRAKGTNPRSQRRRLSRNMISEMLSRKPIVRA